MNSTIEYYNSHAGEYYDRTLAVELDELYGEFLEYVPSGGRIMDLGCGSGRDVKWFRDHGYEAFGLDASEELVNFARERLQLPVAVGKIEEWIADEPYDGIWCCASMMHLDEKCIEQFFSNLSHNLKPDGILYMSVKSGIDTGFDEAGRYFKDFSEADIRDLLVRFQDLELIELWFSEDKLARERFSWMNLIIKNSNNG